MKIQALSLHQSPTNQATGTNGRKDNRNVFLFMARFFLQKLLFPRCHPSRSSFHSTPIFFTDEVVGYNARKYKNKWAENIFRRKKKTRLCKKNYTIDMVLSGQSTGSNLGLKAMPGRKRVCVCLERWSKGSGQQSSLGETIVQSYL